LGSFAAIPGPLGSALVRKEPWTWLVDADSP
jgi:hypothetical protein